MSTTDQANATTSASDLGAWLIDRVRFYDQVPAETVRLDAPLGELGLDSIYVMTLCGDVEDTYGYPLDPTFFADYATLGEVAEALSERIQAA